MIQLLTTEQIRDAYNSEEPNRAEFDGVGEENQTIDIDAKTFERIHGLPWDSENL